MRKNVVKKIPKSKIKTKVRKPVSVLSKLQFEAKAQMKKQNFAMRSCWNCNPGHEHLKKAEYVIWCFGCDHYFYKGRDVTEK